MKYRSKALAALMIGGLSLSGFVLAEGGSGAPYQGMEGKGPHHEMRDGMGGDKHAGREALGKRMIEKLNLSDDQVAKTQELRQQAREDGKPLREKVRAAMQAERKGLESGASERELRKLARKSADARVDMMLHARANEAKFREILTPEQITQLEALEAARKAHREERMKNRQEKMQER